STSTSLSSRGAMNSNETLGFGRNSKSAIRIFGNITNPNLPEDEQAALPGRRRGRLCRPPDEKEPLVPSHISTAARGRLRRGASLARSRDARAGRGPGGGSRPCDRAAAPP